MSQTREVKYQIVAPYDEKNLRLVGDWYFAEWNIPQEKTIEKIRDFWEADLQFQEMMSVDDIPVSTAGLYTHVSLLDKEPRFKIHKHWLALVYTAPEWRRQGLGGLLCNHIETRARALGVNEIHLFTDTAESLYTQLGWSQLERLQLGNRNIVVMRKDL